MNPFNWSGPDFLVFYGILAVVCLGAQYWMRRTRESDTSPMSQAPPLTDPYLVSYLAGRANGLIRCVTISLLERNVLRMTGGKKSNQLVMDPEEYKRQVQSPVEGSVSRFFARPR